MWIMSNLIMGRELFIEKFHTRVLLYSEVLSQEVPLETCISPSPVCESSLPHARSEPALLLLPSTPVPPVPPQQNELIAMQMAEIFTATCSEELPAKCDDFPAKCASLWKESCSGVMVNDYMTISSASNSCLVRVKRLLLPDNFLLLFIDINLLSHDMRDAPTVGVCSLPSSGLLEVDMVPFSTPLPNASGMQYCFTARWKAPFLESPSLRVVTSNGTIELFVLPIGILSFLKNWSPPSTNDFELSWDVLAEAQGLQIQSILSLPPAKAAVKQINELFPSLATTKIARKGETLTVASGKISIGDEEVTCLVTLKQPEASSRIFTAVRSLRADVTRNIDRDVRNFFQGPC